MKIPSNIEFVYHGTWVEFVKDGDPNKPLTPQEIKDCNEVVERIRLMAKTRRKAYENSNRYRQE